MNNSSDNENSMFKAQSNNSQFNQYNGSNNVKNEHQHIVNNLEQNHNSQIYNNLQNDISNNASIDQDTYQQNNISITHKNNMLNLIKVHKRKILIAILILISSILVLTIFNKNSTGKNGYIEQINGTLKIYEKYSIFNMKIISSLEKYTDNEHLLCAGDYIKLKVSIENTTTTDLSLVLTNLELTDQQKDKLYKINRFCIFDDSILNKKIASGSTEEGYIYFYSDKDETNYKNITDYNKMNKIKYLKVSVISEMEKIGDSEVNYEYEDYYLELK